MGNDSSAAKARSGVGPSGPWLSAARKVPPENARHAHQRIPGSERYWMQGSHVAFFLEEGDTAPSYALEWLRGNNPAVQTPGRLP